MSTEEDVHGDAPSGNLRQSVFELDAAVSSVGKSLDLLVTVLGPVILEEAAEEVPVPPDKQGCLVAVEIQEQCQRLNAIRRRCDFLRERLDI